MTTSTSRRPSRLLAATLAIALSHAGLLQSAQAAPLIGTASALLEPLFQDAAMGALPTLRAATDPGVLGGQYFGPDGFAEQRGYPVVVASSRASHDVDAQRRLWAVSEELTSVQSPWWCLAVILALGLGVAAAIGAVSRSSVTMEMGCRPAFSAKVYGMISNASAYARTQYPSVPGGP